MGESPAGHLLSRCVRPEFRSLAKAIHSRCLKLGHISSSVHLVTKLLVAYGRCGVVDEACQVFDEMAKPDTHHRLDQIQPDALSWNAVISACVLNHSDESAFRYFRFMQSYHLPDSHALSSILSSAHCLERNMSSGEQIHCYIIKIGCILLSPSVGNALITFYATWGRLAESVRVFHSMPVRNVISWTALISGHAQNPGHEEESIRLFRFMMRGDADRPNQFTFASILGTCGSLASISQGIQVISLAIKMGILEDIHVQNAQVGFYSECGCLEDARSSFQTIAKPDTISWNSLLKGYAQGGRGREAIRDFQEMLTRGAKPDEITFLSLLSACSHSGMTSQGLQLFQRMKQDYRIQPQPEHIACVVNLLSRAGKLLQAEEFVEKIQSVTSPSVWRTLLGACRMHGNAEDLAELAAKRLLDLEPSDSEAHVVLCNIYADRGRWDLVSEIRRLMRENGVVKQAGYSWITIGGRVHCFTAADGRHPDIHEIETRLMELINNTKVEHEPAMPTIISKF